MPNSAWLLHLTEDPQPTADEIWYTRQPSDFSVKMSVPDAVFHIWFRVNALKFVSAGPSEDNCICLCVRWQKSDIVPEVLNEIPQNYRTEQHTHQSHFSDTVSVSGRPLMLASDHLPQFSDWSFPAVPDRIVWPYILPGWSLLRRAAEDQSDEDLHGGTCP